MSTANAFIDTALRLGMIDASVAELAAAAVRSGTRATEAGADKGRGVTHDAVTAARDWLVRHGKLTATQAEEIESQSMPQAARLTLPTFVPLEPQSSAIELDGEPLESTSTDVSATIANVRATRRLTQGLNGAAALEGGRSGDDGGDSAGARVGAGRAAGDAASTGPAVEFTAPTEALAGLSAGPVPAPAHRNSDASVVPIPTAQRTPIADIIRIRPGGAAVGRYEFRGEIGRGGMGNVLKAHDLDARREVAFKVLHKKYASLPNAQARFLDEAQVTAQLEHPNIVPVHEVARDGEGRLYFTMKVVRGHSLRDKLVALADALRAGRGESVFPLSERLTIFQKICDALAFAHSRGVLHRDLKPDNVMVGMFGEVQVMDWGLAKLVTEREADAASSSAVLASVTGAALPPVVAVATRAATGNGSSSPLPAPAIEPVATDRRDHNLALTMDGKVAGTPAYMSPEQALGQNSRLNERSDVYALGAILYTLLTCAPPYVGDNLVNVLAQVRQGRPVPPRQRARKEFGVHAPDVPFELEAIVLKAMARNQPQRYGSATALKAEIEAFVANLPVAAYPGGPLLVLQKWARRHPIAVLLASFAVVVVLSVVGVTLQWMAVGERMQRDRDELAKAIEAGARFERQAKAESELRRRAEGLRAQEQAEAKAREAEWRDKLRQMQEDLGNRVQKERDQLRQEWIAKFERMDADRDPAAADRFWASLDAREGERILRAFERAVDSSEGDLDDQFYLAVLTAFSRGNLPAAIATLDHVLDVDSLKLRAYFYRGWMRHLAGDESGALEDLNIVVKLNPLDGRALTARGQVKLALKNPAAAAQDFSLVLTHYPTDALAYSLRGCAKAAQKDDDGALADHTRAVSLNPRLAVAYLNRGAYRRAQRDIDGAIADLSQALELRAADPVALTERGLALMAKSDLAAAQSDFEAALRQSPRHWPAMLGRAILLAERKQLSEARDLFTAALEAAPASEHAGIVAERKRLLGE